jgi:uncharacterized protein (TIGR02466 family)
MKIENIDRQSAIISIFPKTVYYVKDVLDSNLNLLVDAIHNSQVETIKDTNLSVNSTHRTFNQLHKVDQFKKLASIIMEHCKKYGSLLGYSDIQLKNLKMTNMWFNKSDQDDFNFPHTHVGSLFSGAYYLKVAEENKISFHDFSNMNLIPENPNNYLNIESWLQCSTNHLLIFQSDLVHSNPRQINTGEKITISFNVVYENLIKEEL